ELLSAILPPSVTWYRYVDDIFSVWPNALSGFDDFLHSLNNLVPSIKFKVEWEVDNKLPFLDIQLHNVNDSLKFSVYRKPTHSGSYLHFFSYHPLHVKKSVVSSMFLRAHRVCSNEFLDSEINYIFDSFGKLGYPRYFLKQALSRARAKYGQLVQPLENNRRDNDRERNMLIVPFNASLDRKRTLLKNAGVDILFTYPNTLRKCLIKNNTRIVPFDSAPGIYEIPCGACPKKYIGETGRTLAKRLQEHKRDVKTGKESNACFIHLRDEGHVIDWSNAKMRHKASNVYERKILESFLIQKTPNFNLCTGHWKMDRLTSSLVTRAFPKLEDNGS
ncbi:MAG: GIY-YIG nuclease family protein, partial [Cyanobacteria bacterium J06553_1]